VGDPRVAQGRRWRVLWVHHEAEELRVHDRATIPEMTARHVIVDLLASRQVARMNAGWLVTRPPGSRPTLQRFCGTVCKDGEAAYLALFINDRCLLLAMSFGFPARSSSLCFSRRRRGKRRPHTHEHDVQQGFHFTSPAKTMRRAQDFQTRPHLPVQTDDRLLPVVIRGLRNVDLGLCFPIGTYLGVAALRGSRPRIQIGGLGPTGPRQVTEHRVPLVGATWNQFRANLGHWPSHPSSATIGRL
jgi:hypothetical protein